MKDNKIDERLAYGFFDATSDALLLIDTLGNIAFLNKKSEALWGYPRSEVVGKPVAILIPDVLATLHSFQSTGSMAAAQSSAPAAGLVLVGHRRNGAEIQIELTLNALQGDSAGSFTVISGHDVSASYAAQKALRAAEERFRLTFDEAPVGMAIVDLEDHFIRVNRSLCHLVGYSPEELVGFSYQAITHPDDVDLHVGLARQLARGEIPRYQLAKRYIHKEGRIVEVMLSVSIVRDVEGQPIHYIAHVDDITPKRRLERARDESLLWLRAVINQCPAAIVLAHGPNGEYMESNKCAQALIGPCADGLGSCSRLVLFDGETQLQGDLHPSSRVMRGEGCTGLTLSLQTTGGELVPILLDAAPIFDAEGEVRGTVMVFQDITLLKQLDQRRAEWNSVIAHDLRQPLNTILIVAQCIARKMPNASVLGNPMASIIQCALRLDRMINDLLDVSRLEVGQLTLIRSPVDLAKLLQASIERASQEAQERRIDLRVLSVVPLACVDADRIEQVMENLLSNAIKYSNPETPISISLQVREQEVLVAVTNTGPGIASEDLPELFCRFHRAKAVRHGSIEGIGLGLYIVQQLIEAHGGHIKAESIPGQQTTFSFTLPCSAS